MRRHSRLNNISIFSGILFMALFMAGCGQKKPDNPRENGPEGRTLEFTQKITFLGKQETEITSIEAAVADEQSERNMGLMDVNELPADKGMLFIFENEDPLSFWMANTPLSLDIIFVNSEMEIVRIHHNTQPFSQKNFTSGDPARYVVETNGGFCVSHDIQEGMKIDW